MRVLEAGLVTGTGDVLCQLQPVVSSQGEHSPSKAGEVLHVGAEGPTGDLGQVGQTSLALSHQLLLHCLRGLLKHPPALTRSNKYEKAKFFVRNLAFSYLFDLVRAGSNKYEKATFLVGNFV